MGPQIDREQAIASFLNAGKRIRNLTNQAETARRFKLFHGTAMGAEATAAVVTIGAMLAIPGAQCIGGGALIAEIAFIAGYHLPRYRRNAQLEIQSSALTGASDRKTTQQRS